MPKGDLFERFDKIKKGDGDASARPPPVDPATDDAKEFEKILGPRTRREPSGGDDIGPFGSVMRGIAKSAAGPMVGAANLAGGGMNLAAKALPSEYEQRVNKFVEQDLGSPQFQSIQRFANEPGRNWWETGGNVGGTLAQLLAGTGEWGLGARAAEWAAARKLPGTWTAAGEFVPRAGSRAGQNLPRAGKLATDLPGQWTSKAARGRQAEGGGFLTGEPPAAAGRADPATWARRGGTAAEVVGKGALGGAITDPTDPLTGAAAGAVTGPAMAGVGALGGTTAGQFTLGHGSMGAIISSALHKAGVPFYDAAGIASMIQSPLMWATLHYRGSPVAAAINDWAMSLGDFVAKHAVKGSTLGGGAGGAAIQSVYPPEENQAPPSVTVPRRAQ